MTLKVTRIIYKIHSFFKADRYDVAVLTLSRPVSYQPHISPICLPDKGDDFEGDYAWAAGWGVMQAGMPSAIIN